MACVICGENAIVLNAQKNDIDFDVFVYCPFCGHKEIR